MEFKQRKRTRLPEYDYSTPGAYFVTICTQDKKHYFGEITGFTMHLSAIGQIVINEVETASKYNPNVEIINYVVMPNHVHLMIRISDDCDEMLKMDRDISEVVRKIKACVTRYSKRCGLLSKDSKLWQTSYHDHIVRGREDYQNIWEYIDTNVQRWEKDRYYE